MKPGNRNVRIFAVNNYKIGGFDIYMDFSGKEEYLMWHRHNAALYDILKDSPRLADLQRIGRADHAYRSVRHILAVAGDLIAEKNECCA